MNLNVPDQWYIRCYDGKLNFCSLASYPSGQDGRTDGHPSSTLTTGEALTHATHKTSPSLALGYSALNLDPFISANEIKRFSPFQPPHNRVVHQTTPGYPIWSPSTTEMKMEMSSRTSSPTCSTLARHRTIPTICHCPTSRGFLSFRLILAQKSQKSLPRLSNLLGGQTAFLFLLRTAPSSER